MADVKVLKEVADILRVDSLVATTSAGSGHPTSCLSAAEIMACLFFSEMHYDKSNPSNPDNDEFILSKGHAAPILYSCLIRSGCIDMDIKKLRKLDSQLEGHPVPSNLGWIKIATGSLGQGLSAGIGMALASKLQKRKYRTFVLMGDSELAEGSIYEALQLAPFYNLHNLIAIADINGLGQTRQTMLGKDLKAYKDRFSGFGWNVLLVDGHNIKQIISALQKSRKSSKPTLILAKTVKGKGVSFLEDKQGWHGKALSEQDLNKALKQIPVTSFPSIEIRSPDKIVPKEVKSLKYKENLYKLTDNIATRQAYGNALANLAISDNNVLAVDAEVSNSTFSDLVKGKTPSQFVETFIAEQNMIGISLGLSKKGFKTYSSTFAAFLSRAHDQLRMSSISDGNMVICGSHSGVSIGEDGASQMGLEDISIFRDLPGSTVLYPSDATSTEKLTVSVKDLPGIKYIRTTRPKTPVLYSHNESFPIGDFKVLRETQEEKKSKQKDQLVLIGSGITLHECLKAHDELKKKKINSAVVDLYSIKPLDTKKLLSFVKKHGSKIVVVEDHYKEGGIGEMLASEFINSDVKMKSLYVNRVPHSGTMDQLLDKYNINSRAIVEDAIKIVSDK